MECSAAAEMFGCLFRTPALCSFMRVGRLRPVSPMYVKLQSLHSLAIVYDAGFLSLVSGNDKKPQQLVTLNGEPGPSPRPYLSWTAQAGRSPAYCLN